MKRFGLILLLSSLACVEGARAAERFPPPQFVETKHELPDTQIPAPRSAWMDIVDAVLLLGAIALASWLALVRRSRVGLLVLTAGCLAYFGFVRAGCICPVGAVQNVTLALFDPHYAIPVVAVAFFATPILATLLFGRTFCAAVCPLGAVQEIVHVRTLRLPAWLNHTLGLGGWFTLGLGVLLAATGSALLICRYDPFVAFFRLGGSFEMIVFGLCLLGIGLFVARPYCRFLCPYGAILRLASRLSWRHVTITPDECVQCRLCETACPSDAIDPPSEPATDHRTQGKTKLAVVLLLLPVLVTAGGFLGRLLGEPLTAFDATIALDRRLADEQAGRVQGTTDATDAFGDLDVHDAFVEQLEAFRATGEWPGNDEDLPALRAFAAENRADVQALRRELLRLEAGRIRGRLTAGGMIFGAFIGLVIGLKLIALSIRRRRADYTPNRATCVSCGRCFRACPVGQKRTREPTK